jgi:hypothetical protein
VHSINYHYPSTRQSSANDHHGIFLSLPHAQQP